MLVTVQFICPTPCWAVSETYFPYHRFMFGKQSFHSFHCMLENFSSHSIGRGQLESYAIHWLCFGNQVAQARLKVRIQRGGARFTLMFMRSTHLLGQEWSDWLGHRLGVQDAAPWIRTHGFLRFGVRHIFTIISKFFIESWVGAYKTCQHPRRRTCHTIECRPGSSRWHVSKSQSQSSADSSLLPLMEMGVYKEWVHTALYAWVSRTLC